MDLKNKFEQSKISPNWLADIPENLLNVLFESGAKANLGNTIKPFQARSFPCVLYWPVKFAALYTVLIADLDWPTLIKGGDCLLLFLVCNVHANDVFKGDILADYIQPMPLKTNRPTHRIVLLVYEQKGYKMPEEHRLLAHQFGNRNAFNLSQFCQKYDLDKPKYGNFFISQYDVQVDKALQSFQDKPVMV